jgi:hypothetical protein
MTATTLVLLAALLGAAGVMCVWAYVTGQPGTDVNRAPERPAPQHSQAARGEVTTRLRPPPPEIPGDRAQRLPRREDLPWNQ